MEELEQYTPIDIEKDLRQSYLAYSLSVIIGRAIPDARDGLKPVHRRILFAQSQMANTYTRPHKKCARVVGDVIGKYHPHGDIAVYNALVRMAQDFSMRDPLEDGQGNFGSIEGDSAAAMRYTSGIAVGMATNIPPHNLGELCDALIRLIDEPDCTVEDLIDLVHGPDFPTAGFVYAGQGLLDAYRTGRGIVKMRGRVEGEERKKGQQSVVIREIPYAQSQDRLVLLCGPPARGGHPPNPLRSRQGQSARAYCGRAAQGPGRH